MPPLVRIPHRASDAFGCRKGFEAMGTCRPRAGLFLPVLIFAVILPAVFATSPCRADVRSTLLKAYSQ